MRILHLQGWECALCAQSPWKQHLHHVYPRGQGGDDVEANLVSLCFSCHEKIHANDRSKWAALGQYLAREQQEFFGYLDEKLGLEQSAQWCEKLGFPYEETMVESTT